MRHPRDGLGLGLGLAPREKGEIAPLVTVMGIRYCTE